MTRGGDVETVERIIPAPAERIFALLADAARHPDIDGSGTVREAKQVPERLAMGATFGMSMEMGFAYSMVSTIIEFEEGRRIAWQTRASSSIVDRVVGGRIWRYELEPVDGGTLVRESWDISEERIKAVVRPYRRKARTDMAATLERIEQLLAV